MTEIIEDLVIPNKAKQQQVSNTDNIKPILKSVERSSTQNIIKFDSPIKNIPQVVTTSNDQTIIDEKPSKQIAKIDVKVVSETSNNVSSTKSSTNITLEIADKMEPMDVESKTNSKLINESLNNVEDDEEEDNEKFIGMLNDFIDSD